MGAIGDFLIGKTGAQIDSEYGKAIKDARQSRADAEYNYRYDKALYDANKDYFDSVGVSDPTSPIIASNGRQVNALQNALEPYDTHINSLTKEREDEARRNKYNIYGNGLIGNILNPFHQTGTAIQDLATSGISKWQSGERDWLSDLGAAGEAALTAAPFAGGAMKVAKGVGGAAKAAKTVAHPLLSAAGKGAAWGAGYGALGSISENGAQNFNLGDLLTRTAVGGVMGGGMGAATYGLGKFWNKYSQPAPSKSTDIMPYNGNDSGSAEYQGYLKTLKDAGIDTSSADTLKKSYRQAMKTVHPDQNPASAKLASDLNAAYDAIYGVNGEKFADSMAKATAPVGLPVISGNSSPLTIGQKWKNVGRNIPTMGKDLAKTKAGTAVSKLLKTKTGKIGAGLGTGLLLSQLMRGQPQDNGLTDEELEQLYNIYYGGQ